MELAEQGIIVCSHLSSRFGFTSRTRCRFVVNRTVCHKVLDIITRLTLWTGRPSDYGFKEQQEEGMDGSERRSSVWSKLSSSGSPGTSPSNRRGSILNMFRKNSIAEAEKPEGEN